MVNIGDTVLMISEVGLEKGEEKKPEDFEYDPDESSDDSEEWSGDDESKDGGPLPGWIDRHHGGPPHDLSR